MSGFGVISFDALFEPVKATPVNADRLFGFDSQGNVNAAFTILGLRNLFGGGDWNTMANKPAAFPAEAHTLASHSDTLGLATAPDGVFMGKVAGKWSPVTPNFASLDDIPVIPSWILSITEAEKANWNTAFGWGPHAALYKPNSYVPDWADLTNVPEAFTPEAHTLGSHSDATGLAAATAGQLVRKGAEGFEPWTPDYYSPSNLPPADSTIPDFVRDFDPVIFEGYNAKLLEYQDFPDGAMPVLYNGRVIDGGIMGTFSVNPFDPELESEDWEAWEEAGPEVLEYTFPVPVKGVAGTDGANFALLSQVPVLYENELEAIAAANSLSATNPVASMADLFSRSIFDLLQNGATDGQAVVWSDTNGRWEPRTVEAGSGVPPGGTTGQVLKKQSNADGDADWADESGGGGSVEYLTDLDTWPILKFDKNYRYIHEMTGPIEISAHLLAPLPVPGNFNKIYIKANGVDKPDFTELFEVIWDNWNNTAGHWNRVYPEYTPEGKVILQIEQAHLGTANDGSGSNTITVTFEANHVQQHIISASTQIVIDPTDAEVGFETILYIKSDGVNKPFWDSDDVVVTYDNYINLADVWNRFKIEWRPENKAVLQIINT